MLFKWREFTEVAEIAERVKEWSAENKIYRFQLHTLIFWKQKAATVAECDAVHILSSYRKSWQR